MADTYWQKQTDKPLFPDLIWSRPENKRQAGKLLIVGGNLHGFAAPAEAYQTTEAAGIGIVKVLLPDVLKKVVGQIIEHGEYAPSTPSGSFSQKGLDELLLLDNWSDGTLLAGDFGRNSETAILIEKFLHKTSSPLTITKDAVDYITSAPQMALDHPKISIVLPVAQLQLLAKQLNHSRPIRFGMDLLQLVEALHELSSKHRINLITKHLEHILVAVEGNVSITKLLKDIPIWRLKTAAYISVWWLQNADKPFEALTTAVFESIS